MCLQASMRLYSNICAPACSIISQNVLFSALATSPKKGNYTVYTNDNVEFDFTKNNNSGQQRSGQYAAVYNRSGQ